MAYLQSLLAPHSLNINDSNVAVKWNEWKELWLHYSIAVKVNKEAGEVKWSQFSWQLVLKRGKSLKLGIYPLVKTKILKLSSSNSTTTVTRERMFLLSDIVLISNSKSLGGCLCSLRECMFWPGMSLQMKDFVG